MRNHRNKKTKHVDKPQYGYGDAIYSVPRFEFEPSINKNPTYIRNTTYLKRLYKLDEMYNPFEMKNWYIFNINNLNNEPKVINYIINKKLNWVLKWWLQNADIEYCKIDSEFVNHLSLNFSFTEDDIKILELILINNLRRNFIFEFDKKTILQSGLSDNVILFWLKCFKIKKCFNDILNDCARIGNIKVISVWGDNREKFGSYYECDKIVDTYFNSNHNFYNLNVFFGLMKKYNLTYTSDAMDKCDNIDILNAWINYKHLFELKYTHLPLERALHTSNYKLLEWWGISGLKLSYDVDPKLNVEYFDNCKLNFVLAWTMLCKLPIYYTEKLLTNAMKQGNDNSYYDVIKFCCSNMQLKYDPLCTDNIHLYKTDQPIDDYGNVISTDILNQNYQITEDSLDYNEMCPICMDLLREKSCLKLICNHKFHAECINLYWGFNSNSNSNSIYQETSKKCPYCRKSLKRKYYQFKNYGAFINFVSNPNNKHYIVSINNLNICLEIGYHYLGIYPYYLIKTFDISEINLIKEFDLFIKENNNRGKIYGLLLR
jgi:hypothetical protein